MSKLLTVFGATGQQGGSLIDYILKHPKLSTEFQLRGVTRDVSKPAALVLKERGVEIIKADMDDKFALKHAVKGSYAIFAVTNFWEKASAEIEIAQGKAMADAAVAAGATLLIWSSLPHVTRMTGGKLSGVKHFDSKADVETYIRGLPIKSTFYMPAFYMQNMTSIYKPKPNKPGALEFAVTWSPQTQIPLIDITDTGKFLALALLAPEKYNHKSLTAATAFYTPQKCGTSSSSLPPAMMAMVKESAGLITEYSYYGPTGMKDLEWTLAQMEDAPGSWEDFVQANEPWFDG